MFIFAPLYGEKINFKINVRQTCLEWMIFVVFRDAQLGFQS